MPTKNKAKRPIGKGKKGSGKRAIYEAGGGQGALRMWRNLTQEVRKSVRTREGGLDSVMEVVDSQRKLRKGKKRAGVKNQPARGSRKVTTAKTKKTTKKTSTPTGRAKKLVGKSSSNMTRMKVSKKAKASLGKSMKAAVKKTSKKSNIGYPKGKKPNIKPKSTTKTSTPTSRSGGGVGGGTTNRKA